MSGVGRSALRGPSWRRVRRGFYVPAGAGLAVGERRLTPTQRIVDLTPLLTERTLLGTWAAAFVLGVDWLDGLDPHSMAELPIDVIAGDRRRRQRHSPRYQFTDVVDEDVVVRDGLRVTGQCRTAFDGARWADSLEDAVVFLDAMKHFGRLDLTDFTAYVDAHQGWTGVNQAAKAAELARKDVKSTWETRLRLCWLLEAGLPEPLINVPIFDESGHFLGMGDLFDPESGLIAEFDGEQHRDAEHHRLDNIREEKLESANLVVVRCDKTDVRHNRRQLVSRLHSGYARGNRRDRNQDRWTLSQPDWWLRRQKQLLRV